MKTETVQTLIIARTLFDKARELCSIENKFTASAGLVILQDALELFIYACLIELGADQEEDLENFKFNQLLGELKKRGKKVIKSGTLKALNRERVQVKHYGQVAEPTTVVNYFSAANSAIDTLINDVLGKSFQDIFLYDLLKDGESKEHLKRAVQLIEEEDYYEALVEIRKAIFVEIEEDFSVEGFEYRSMTSSFDLLSLTRGRKAPWPTKNKEWIEENVQDPFDFIRIDNEKLRIDLMEWGITTQDYWNLWRLTPNVFRFWNSKKWIYKHDHRYLVEAANEENAKYCLDSAINLILKKQSHFDLGRYLNLDEDYGIRAKLKVDSPLYKKASKD